MNKRMLPAAAVALAALAAMAGCQKPAAPAVKTATATVQPKLLDIHLDKALANQQALIARAAALKTDDRLPVATAHSAGAQAEAALARQEAVPAKPSSADDKRSLAIWFSGNEIGETDPCG